MARSTWEPLSHTQDRLSVNHCNWLLAELFLNFPVLFCLLSPTVFYLNHAGVLAAAAAKTLESCPTLCDPIDGSPPGSPIPGILQARTLEWVAISVSNA